MNETPPREMVALAALIGMLACTRDYSAAKGTVAGMVALSFQYADEFIKQSKEKP